MSASVIKIDFLPNNATSLNTTLSSYFSQPMYEALYILSTRIFPGKDLNIICPLYSKLTSDFQIGITGKAKKGETYEDAMKREMVEEVGLIPTSPVQIFHKVNHKGEEYRIGYVFLGDCGVVKTIDQEYKNYQNMKVPDQYNRRVGVYILSERKSVTDKKVYDEYFKNAYGGYYNPIEKDIVGVLIYNVRDLIKTSSFRDLVLKNKLTISFKP